MDRRGFLSLIAGIPFLKHIKPKGDGRTFQLLANDLKLSLARANRDLDTLEMHVKIIKVEVFRITWRQDA